MYSTYAELRDKAGFTDYKVSSETGVSRSTFTEWKSGRSKPKADKLLKIARFLGVSVEELIEEEK